MQNQSTRPTRRMKSVRPMPAMSKPTKITATDHLDSNGEPIVVETSCDLETSDVTVAEIEAGRWDAERGLPAFVDPTIKVVFDQDTCDAARLLQAFSELDLVHVTDGVAHVVDGASRWHKFELADKRVASPVLPVGFMRRAALRALIGCNVPPLA